MNNDEEVFSSFDDTWGYGMQKSTFYDEEFFGTFDDESCTIDKNFRPQTSIKFTEVKKYVSEMKSLDKITELLNTIDEDTIQNFIRGKKINRILKRNGE